MQQGLGYNAVSLGMLHMGWTGCLSGTNMQFCCVYDGLQLMHKVNHQHNTMQMPFLYFATQH